MGTRDRQEITTTDHHPHTSKGSPSDRTEGRGNADAGAIKQISAGSVVEF